MGKVFWFLFERLVDPLGLPIEAWKEYLILLAIGEIAYIITFYVVGRMYDNHDISSSESGSIFHWGIRLTVFVIMWAVTYGVIWLAQFIATYMWWVIGVLGVIVVILTIIRFCIEHNFKCVNREIK